MNIVEIQSECGAASARILPELGLNCFSLTLSADGEAADIIWSPEGFESGQVRPSSGGVPILFPFPGRIRNGKFAWNGKNHELPANDRRGNAIHGFVLDRSWNILEVEKSSVKADFRASTVDQSILKLWPADFLIEVEYRFASASRFEMTAIISNPDQRSLPFGFGLHPYFQISTNEDAEAETRVELPLSRRWELENLVPNGISHAVEQAEEYQTGLAFSEMEFDDVFTVKRRDEMQPDISRIISERTQFEYEFSKFDYCVVYTPASRAAVCVEPYSAIPNFFELTEQGIDCGLKTLSPGDSVEYKTAMVLKARKNAR